MYSIKLVVELLSGRGDYAIRKEPSQQLPTERIHLQNGET